MVITLAELVGNKENWLHSEILKSITPELIESASETKQINVQLLINNTALEPKLLEDLFSNLEDYINKQAEYKISEKMEELEHKMEKIFEPLEMATKDALEKIREEFDIKEME